MTMRKKLIITIMALSCVLCILVTGTLAWLTDTTPSIKNTFNASSIEVTISENGAVQDSNNANLLNGYYRIIPGMSITKDPKVTVTSGSLDCYVFVKIEENTGSLTGNFKDYISYTVADEWTALGNGVSNVYYMVVDGNTYRTGEAYSILEGDTITFSADITKSHMQAILSGTLPTLTFTAYAIQKDALTDQNADSTVDARDAWIMLGN